MAKSLKEKTMTGLGWSAIDFLTSHGVQFVIGIVLARLLSPDDYGLIGLTAIFSVVCSTLINGGFSSALIRTKNASDRDYNTSFIINFLMSLLLYSIIFLCAPFIASFFGREELIALVRVMSLGLIINSLGMVQSARLTKRIDFKTQTKITLVASVLSGFIGIVMALFGYGVWALVAQQLSSHTLNTLLLFYFNRWLPSLSFSKESFHRLFGFGWKIMVSNLLSTVFKELTQVIIGKFYTPGTLGQYTRATHFSKLLSNNITNMLQRVTYPVLSNIQDEHERLKSAFRRIIKMSTFATAVSLLFLGAISEPLIYCLIGPKWHEAAVYLPFICMNGVLYPLTAVNMNMLSVQGRSGILLTLEIVKKTISLVPLFIGAFIGIVPMLLANIVTGIIDYLINSHFSGKMLKYSSWEQIKDTAPSFGVAFLIALSVWFLKYLPLSYWVILPIQICVGILVFFLVCSQTRLSEYKEMKETVMSFISKTYKRHSFFRTLDVIRNNRERTVE